MTISKKLTAITFNEEERKIFIETSNILQQIIEAMKGDSSYTMLAEHYADFTQDDVRFFIEFCDSIKEKSTWTLVF